MRGAGAEHPHRRVTSKADRHRALGLLGGRCLQRVLIDRQALTDPRVRAISFTGSVATGNAVRDEATGLGKRVQLELGGHNPLIVMADADLDRAVEASYAGAFWSAGQKCTATRRIYVQDEVYDSFKQKLVARIERGKVGDGIHDPVWIGERRRDDDR